MILYGDVFLLVNGGMDFFILWLTGVIVRRKVPLWRLIAACVVMAICPLIGIALPTLKYLYSPLGSVVILFIGVILAFRPKRLKQCLELTVIAYLVSFTVGGCGMALFYIFGAPAIFSGNVVFQTRLFPLKLLIVLTAFFYTTVKLLQNLLETRFINRKDYCSVIINHNGKDVAATALIDNGNGLKDPFSSYPVLIVAFSALQAFFTLESRSMFFKKTITEAQLQEYLMANEKPLALRLVPYSSLGNKSGLLLVFRPDNVKLVYCSGNLSCNEVMVGVYLGCFEGGYDAILNPELLKKEERL